MEKKPFTTTKASWLDLISIPINYHQLHVACWVRWADLLLICTEGVCYWLSYSLVLFSLPSFPPAFRQSCSGPAAGKGQGWGTRRWKPTQASPSPTSQALPSTYQKGELPLHQDLNLLIKYTHFCSKFWQGRGRSFCKDSSDEEDTDKQAFATAFFWLFSIARSGIKNKNYQNSLE